jgi:hypothetical protein
MAKLFGGERREPKLIEATPTEINEGEINGSE